MDNDNYFKGLLQSIQDYKKLVLLIPLIQNDDN